MTHRTPIHIRFADIDKFQHVNNAVYLTYAEQARIVFFDDKLGNTIDWKAKGMILAKAEANYKIPLVMGDNIFVETSCTRIGSKSITLFYSIIKLENGKEIEACNGETVLVAFDYVNNCSMPVLEEWRDKLS